MRLHRVPLRRRDGFTLVELLVVMAIIAVLISLTTAAVFAAFAKMNEVKDRNEITGLSTGLKEFESEYNITFPPPSRLWLDKQGTYSTPPVGFTAAQMGSLAQLGVDSRAYLLKVWPRLWQNGPVDWNGDGNANEGFVLEGEQCLVFFLGGARNANGAFIGFSVDPTNPMNPNAAIKRKGPYFQFVMNRVQPGPTNNFPIYFDAYSSSPPNVGTDKPYAYFSSGKSANGYNAYVPFGLGPDCPSLQGFDANNVAGPLQPYSQPGGPPTVFYNPDTFQIISAGKNKAFGIGGAYSSATALTMGKAGLDDLTNFNSSQLGAGQ